MNSAPSQVAHADTPYFWNFSSDGMPSHLADAPVAMISVSATSSPSVETMRNGRSVRSTAVTSAVTTVLPNRSACALNSSISAGPSTPLGNPG